MMDDIENLGRAETLGQLRELIDRAIETFGADTDWNGWDDGSLCINDQSGNQVAQIDRYEQDED